MSVETELKLSLSPGQIGKLKKHPLLASLSVTPPNELKLYSVYYDTPKLTLRKHAMALRLRRVGKQWLQTLKGGGGVHAGLHQRNEWETPVKGESLDLDALKASGGKLPAGVHKKLQPAFVTEFTRHFYQLSYKGTAIELALDRGEIRAGKKTRTISEVELELKSGEPQQLFNLALALSETVLLEVENVSKAEYGYRLFSGETPSVRKSGFKPLDPSQSVASALRDMIAICLMHMQANIPGAVRGQDEEYLHQVRVGLRRLRVVLAMTAMLCADDELHLLREELKVLNNEFGKLREWDVFATQTLQAICADHPKRVGLDRVVRASEKQRKQCHDEVVQRLVSPEYQRLLLRIGAWLQGEYWRAAEQEEGLKLTDFAKNVQRFRLDEVEKLGKRVADADAAQLHALRIACKKLRYSAEMFMPLRVMEKPKRFIATLARLQEILGRLNDIAIANHQLDEMKDDIPQVTQAMMRNWLAQRRTVQMGRLGKAWKKFSG